MNRLFKILPLVIVASLTACEKYEYVGRDDLLVFGTTVSLQMKVENSYNGSKTYKDIEKVLKRMDELADATKQREATNVWSLNQTNEKLEISEDFYYLLKRSQELQETVKYFNPLIGSLSNKWKKALNPTKVTDEPRILTNEEIQEELEKINTSKLIIEETEKGWYAQRIGEAEIDLGAMAKGYALDACLNKLDHCTGDTKDYLFNLANSSILLGYNSKRIRVWKQPDYDEGVYVVDVTNIRNKERLRLFNSFISTSGVSEQGVKIEEQMYSHIINPKDGSAINNFDQITVINADVWNNGSLGDALSTSLMLGTIDDIKEAESRFGIKAIAIKDGEIKYTSDGVNLYF